MYRECLQIGGREFIPVATHRPHRAPWLDGFIEGMPYPYLTDPYEAQHAVEQQALWAQHQRIQFGPFIPGGASGSAKLDEVPTAAREGELVGKIASIVATDWPECKVQPL